MDFEKLISDFAERHGIADLAAEDNAAALDIDGIVVTLVAAQVEAELLLPGEVSYRNHSNVWPILKSRIAGSSPVRSMTKSCVTLQMPTEASFSETSAWT